MAGSCSHVIEDDGRFVNNETFVNMIENLGDSYEMAEEMYGMIWYLANALSAANGQPGQHVASHVEMARLRYEQGIAVSPGIADD